MPSSVTQILAEQVRQQCSVRHSDIHARLSRTPGVHGRRLSYVIDGSPRLPRSVQAELTKIRLWLRKSQVPPPNITVPWEKLGNSARERGVMTVSTEFKSIRLLGFHHPCESSFNPAIAMPLNSVSVFTT